MTEPYVGAEAVAMNLGATWLAASSTFSTTLGGSRATITEGEQDTLADTSVATAFMFPEPSEWTRVEPEVFLGEVRIHVDILWPAYADKPSSTDSWRRALGHLSSIRAEIIAAAVAAGHMGLRQVHVDAPPRRLEPSADPPGAWEASLTLTFMAGNL